MKEVLLGVVAALQKVSFNDAALLRDGSFELSDDELYALDNGIAALRLALKHGKKLPLIGAMEVLAEKGATLSEAEIKRGTRHFRKNPKNDVRFKILSSIAQCYEHEDKAARACWLGGLDSDARQIVFNVLGGAPYEHPKEYNDATSTIKRALASLKASALIEIDESSGAAVRLTPLGLAVLKIVRKAP